MNDLDLLLESPTDVVCYLDDHHWPLKSSTIALSREDVRAYLVDRRWYVGQYRQRDTLRKALKANGWSPSWSWVADGSSPGMYLVELTPV